MAPWLTAWLVLVLLLWARRRWLRWSARLAGWLLLVPVTAALAEQWRDDLGPAASPLWSGGSVGAFLADWLAAFAAPWPRAAVLGAGAVGLFLRAPGRLVDQETQDAPPFTLSPAAKAGIAVAFGTAIAGMSRGGQSADAWAEGALTRRGVRRPRLWMGVVAAGASLAMSAADRRRTGRDEAPSTR